MPVYYKGIEITGPRGPSGPDGNPIGTVISYMGANPPSGYLTCDGAIYGMTDYPELADHFLDEFGSASHFGGDGKTTFAVPDMRNLFLRGYHGEAEEQLSGNVGERQAATSHVGIQTFSNGVIYRGSDENNSDNHDTKIIRSSVYGYAQDGYNNAQIVSKYTARPVNMAVLYCIKAVPSEPVLEEYDTEDGWHVRKWSDGYADMKVTFESQTTYENEIMPNLYRHSIDAIPNPPEELIQTYRDGCLLVSADNETVGWLIANRKSLQIAVPWDTGKRTIVLTRETAGRWR